MRTQRRRTSLSFTPLADMFISAIATLLVLLIVSSSATNSVVSRIPQADAIYACGDAPKEATVSTGPSARRVHPPSGDQPQGLPAASIVDDAFAASHAGAGRLSLRIAVQSSPRGHDCLEEIERAVETHNNRFDDPKAKLGKRLLITLSIVQMPPPAADDDKAR